MPKRNVRALSPAGFLAWLILGLSAGSAGSAEGPVGGSDRPNFIVIVFDDLGYHDVGYHDSDISTPNLDAIARESVVFDEFYVFPWCAATRAALETGYHPAAFGIRSLQLNFANRTTAFPRKVATVAERLQRVGYSTWFVGKWDLSRDFSGGPLRRGYQHSYGYMSGQIDHVLHDDHQGRHVLFSADRFVEEPGHMTDLIGRQAALALSTARRPFFLKVSFSAPHYPVQSLPEYEDRNRHIENADRRAYAGMVTHVDEVIGKLVQQMAESGELENTFVFILSDNGGQMSWSNPDYYGGRFPGSGVMALNTPFRDSKTSLYEGGVRVPALVLGPRSIATGRWPTYATVLDVVATVLAQAGADGSDLEGVKLFDPAFRRRPHDEAFVWQTNSLSIPFGGGHQEAIRFRNYKLVRSQRRFGWFPSRWRWPVDKVELFDLSIDPEETRDLSGDFPELTSRLLVLMDAKLALYEREYEEYVRSDRQ